MSVTSSNHKHITCQIKQLSLSLYSCKKIVTTLCHSARVQYIKLVQCSADNMDSITLNMRVHVDIQHVFQFGITHTVS